MHGARNTSHACTNKQTTHTYIHNSRTLANSLARSSIARTHTHKHTNTHTNTRQHPHTPTHRPTTTRPPAHLHTHTHTTRTRNHARTRARTHARTLPPPPVTTHPPSPHTHGYARQHAVPGPGPAKGCCAIRVGRFTSREARYGDPSRAAESGGGRVLIGRRRAVEAPEGRALNLGRREAF